MNRRLSAFAALAVTVVVLVFGCSTENALVGGTCASFATACGGRCVDLTSDNDNCGACGAWCGSDVTCGSGVCGGPIDGASDGPGRDGANDGADLDGANDGALAAACPPPPYDNAANCGFCGNACTVAKPICRPNRDRLFSCHPRCTQPLVDCDGMCTDVNGNDAQNCGACFKTCPSNICAAGICEGGAPGDIVLFGHDYRFTLPNSLQAKLLTNAVFIPTTNPVRILSYEQYAEPAAVSQVKTIIASLSGRTVTYTVANAGAALQAMDLPVNYDVVLVYDQAAADAATLSALGTASSSALNSFAKAGGVIVILDGAAGSGAMPSFTTSGGLISLLSHTSIPGGTRVQIVAPADAVGSLAASPYGTFNRSVTFQSNEPNGGNVVYVTERLVAGVPTVPVIIHKVVP